MSRFRCAAPGDPRVPPVYIDGCGIVNGIAYLDEIVEAGAMSELDVLRTLSGNVKQHWKY